MEYLTESFEPWDFIAKKVYGSEYYAYVLMNANPFLLKHTVVPPGVAIKVPEVKKEFSGEVPPWKK